ncbi:DUF1090 domain-containing protein [Vibrio gangliei]|uniref:DUF1090 domain-containing protein n=1 Tax=Vibrio gangliei TaxID=2077090 RepID=UPI001300B79A|nr:DUF1090 domain-containing protein [Vibrio gangliei]
MKHTLIATSVLSLLVGFSANAAQNCEDLTGCDAKVCHIEKQLEYAKEKGNTNKEKGLTNALENIKKHCTVDGLKGDLHKDIADIKDDLAEHQDDLAEAMEEQESDKIAKYQQKIEEDQAKLETLQAELKKLK